MAGLSGFQATHGIARQTAKGTAATVSKYVLPFTGGSAGPERVVERLQETDNNRDPGSSYLVRGGAAGAPEFYVRPDSFPLYAVAALGDLATTAAAGGNNNIHAITTAGSQPYCSFFKTIGNKVFERYEDCLVNSLTVRAEAGQPLTAVCSFLGLSSTIQTADFGTPPAADTDEPWFFHEATVTLGGVVHTNVRSFEISVENNVSQQQTDSIALYDAVPGRRDLSFSFDMIFDDTVAYNDYRTFVTGSSGGTTQAGTLITQALLFEFQKGTGSTKEKLTFSVPVAAYEEFPVDPDAGGDPVISSVRGAGVRPPSGAFTTWTVENSVANAAGVAYGDS